MISNEEWVEAKSKETYGHNFLRSVLNLSGYKVMNFGIENHNQQLIKEIAANYAHDTNKRLLSMPDFVVIDNETKECTLVEVKFRTMEQKASCIFRYGLIKQYIDYWIDCTLIMVLTQEPYCMCIDVKDIDWNRHFVKKDYIKNNRVIEIWNFEKIWKPIQGKFPKVTEEHVKKAVQMSGIALYSMADKN